MSKDWFEPGEVPEENKKRGLLSQPRYRSTTQAHDVFASHYCVICVQYNDVLGQ